MRKSWAEAAETSAGILSASEMFLDKGLETVGTRDVMVGAGLKRGRVLSAFSVEGQSCR